ncbi:MAG: XdhC family protein [Sediminibacterium sp.]|nr:XdhC family protein [Sediminibacterium sp.]
MKEIRDIVDAYDVAVKNGKKTALATVVHVSGSSYRRPGARMLVTEDGQLTGAISGGCLEGDALRKAVLAITQAKNKLVVYDTTDEDDAKLGVQLGCNGIVQILFEPIHPDQQNPIHLLKKIIQDRSNAVLITGYSINQQTHLGTIDHSCFNNEKVLPFAPALKAAIIKVEDASKSAHCTIDIEANQQQFFIEYSLPSIAFVVVGAGNDAMPLVQMAHLLGWNTTLVDGRPTHATRSRFAVAENIIIGKPKEILPQLTIDNRTAIVLMTHNYNYDTELLGLLNQYEVPYIGLLGPQAKRVRMLQELEEAGIHFSAEQLEHIYGPTGLNLGAETAEEIALSICSEIMAVLQEKDPQHLKNKVESIHAAS